jgi:hypothetical protein
MKLHLSGTAHTGTRHEFDPWYFKSSGHKAGMRWFPGSIGVPGGRGFPEKNKRFPFTRLKRAGQLKKRKPVLDVFICFCSMIPIFRDSEIDGKSRKTPSFVIPAKTGIQKFLPPERE